MSDEKYVLININTLSLYQDEYNDTNSIGNAMKFDTLQKCKDELLKFDDDVKDDYKIYKLLSQLKIRFERVIEC